jgi:hypothetical protein
VSTRLDELLRAVAEGTLGPADARARLHHSLVEDLGFAQVDHLRAMTQGAPEVVFGEGKRPEQIVAICRALQRAGGQFLCTRLSPDAQQALRDAFPAVDINQTARTAYLAPDAPNSEAVDGRVLMVTAGTSDLPVAEEAAVCARAFGLTVERLNDAGVAGIHRILGGAPMLQNAAAIIVIAGMDGALPSVVGGMVSCPVIAVPTSVGYGAAFGGIAPLLAMLNSCAAGVVVVNIDAGFSAAAAAARIVRAAVRRGA